MFKKEKGFYNGEIKEIVFKKFRKRNLVLIT